MSEKKKLFVFSLAAVTLLTTLFAACGTNAEPAADSHDAVETEAVAPLEEVRETSEITIVYTNDVHSYLANTYTPEGSEEEVAGLRLSNVSQLVKDYEAEGRNVILADAGDQIQGSIYGAYDSGLSAVKLYNAAGYDVATPGNHEFDYGMNQFFYIVDKADYPFISCNFNDLQNKNRPLESYKIFEFDGTKVAFIGITTPDTITSSTPIYFQDEQGNYIYGIDGTAQARDLYDSVQAVVDEVKEDVDYVIALGHLGIGREAQDHGISSDAVIANTSGIDAFIDGHSHSTVEGETIKNQNGEDVLLTQTGSYLANVGVMTIRGDGTISTELLQDYEGVDEAVAELEEKLINTVEEELGKPVAKLDFTLYTNNPENAKQRLIRTQELNAGDFTADSIYWYINDAKQLDCDVAIINGGGVRAQLEAGMLTEQDIRTICPFGNQVCLISVSGQQIKDALEMGASLVGIWDDERNALAENGGFLHVAGLKYAIDSSVTSSVEVDENGMFQAVSGDYKVTDIHIYNKDTATYEPIDLTKEYTLGGCNYLLRNGGGGLSMFSDCEMIVDYLGQDSDILSAYCKSFTMDGDYALINTANCPLSHDPDYGVDYENPFGAGRITIIGS